MEKDIELLNDYLEENDRKLVTSKRLKFLQAIENLITKYKEQEKIIELMAEYISIQKWENDGSKESVIHYFKKKAKGE